MSAVVAATEASASSAATATATAPKVRRFRPIMDTVSFFFFCQLVS